MLGRIAVLAPASQHIFNFGVWKICEMRRVRPVHCNDVGQNIWPHIIIIVGRDFYASRALDEKRGMTDEGKAYVLCGELNKTKRSMKKVRRLLGHKARAAVIFGRRQ